MTEQGKALLVFATLSSNAYVQRKYASRTGQNQFFQQSSNVQNERTKETTIEGIGRLTTSLLNDIHQQAGSQFNIVLSPLSIWTILAMLLEGAGGKTELELKEKLNATGRGPEDARSYIRSRYRELHRLTKDKSGPTEFQSLNYVISDKKLYPEFQKTIEDHYDGKYFTYDQRKKSLFAIMVNGWAVDKSEGKLSSIVTPAMLDNLVLLVGNAVYFKSKWRIPFDPLDTISLPFKNEGGEVIDNVPMMNLAGVFPLGYNTEFDFQMVEIPYADNSTSMLIILPHENVGLRRTLSAIRNLSLKEIIPINMSEETVQLSLPRFRIISKMYLNDILKQDLSTAFSSQTAEFPRMGNDVFVSWIYHKAEIDNTEEGTTASAVTSE
ncbi:hypothetical protein RUM44_013518 [Polyplax serrata]|uniref:Serpin domain-containing protein n=1 Tax=Polyplax serrata TaxID=468196 RepID=A0ABR1BEE0_POLSC